jgi:hypothetical protein
VIPQANTNRTRRWTQERKLGPVDHSIQSPVGEHRNRHQCGNAPLPYG